MRGLKGQESKSFERFFALVQHAAAEKNALFFAFAGEGRTFTSDDMEGEDLSGWLIPIERADVFERQWNQNNSLSALQEWTDFFVWAVWNIENEMLSVHFEYI